MMRLQSSSGAKPGVRVIVASGSTLTRMALVKLLETDDGIEVCAVAAHETEAAQSLQADLADVLITEPALLRRLEDTLQGLATRPRILLVGATPHCGTDAPTLGMACGFASERAAIDHIRVLLDTVSHCGRALRSAQCPPQCRALRSLDVPRLPLTPREYSVFLHIGSGESNMAIAAALGVSVKTIEAHREAIKRKLGLNSASRLAEAAILWRRGEFEGPAPPPSGPVPLRRSA